VRIASLTVALAGIVAGRAGHDVPHRLREIAAGSHQLERIALRDDAHQIGAFADHHGARALRTKQPQRVADRRIDRSR
jgi:hypothetical protein